MENTKLRKVEVETAFLENLDFMDKGFALEHISFPSKPVRKSCKRALPGYENCQASDIVLNFFIARTLTAGTVRMDGLFKQIAHREFFLDGIGKLRIGLW